MILVFWRNGCAPCDEYAPALDRLAKKWTEQVLVVKVDADSEPGLVLRYRVTNLPSTVFIRLGKSIATAEGRLAEQLVDRWIAFLVHGGDQPEIPSGPSVAIPGARQSSGSARGGGDAHAGAQRPEARGTGAPVVMTDANFDEILRSTRLPILVDFWAAWCGPCKMIAPTVTALAKEFAGRAVVAKVDVDHNPAVAGRYGVMSIPTLLIFRNGRVIDQLVGAQPADVLREHLVRVTSAVT